MDTFAITSTVRSYPKLPYQDIKDDILGKKYSLSLAFIGDIRSQRLNEEHRGKTYTPNVLSFPLDTNIGEVFITPTIAKKEAHKFNLSHKGYVGFLFIHACLHLKGLPHGDKMDKLEQKYVTKYKLR
ncbi:MAG: rRNA maturation RNase YbeY [Patiriisocius sp.]|jgi:rRNA maturation RNase YbeY